MLSISVWEKAARIVKGTLTLIEHIHVDVENLGVQDRTDAALASYWRPDRLLRIVALELFLKNMLHKLLMTEYFAGAELPDLEFNGLTSVSSLPLVEPHRVFVRMLNVNL